MQEVVVIGGDTPCRFLAALDESETKDPGPNLLEYRLRMNTILAVGILQSVYGETLRLNTSVT